MAGSNAVPETTTIASPNITDGGASNNTTPVAIFKKAVNDATGTVANLNLAAADFINCFIGPRHEHILIYTTMTAIGLMIFASIVPWMVTRVTRYSCKKMTQHDSNLIALFENFFSKGQLILIFLVYPALTMTIMRTFVCKE